MSRVFNNWYRKAEQILFVTARRTGYSEKFLAELLDEALAEYWHGDSVNDSLDGVLLDVIGPALELDY